MNVVFCFSKFEDFLPDDSDEDANILEMVVCLMKVCQKLESNLYAFMNICICIRTNKTVSIIIDLYQQFFIQQQSFLFLNSRLILVFVFLYKFSRIVYSFFEKASSYIFGYLNNYNHTITELRNNVSDNGSEIYGSNRKSL